MARTKKPFESPNGRYTPLPHMLLDSTAFMGASHRTRSLILELMRQHNGTNNGHLHLALGWLKARGWASADGVQKSKQEALERGLIIKTREGGLNLGADRYALTWLPITNFVGLQLTQKDYHPGRYLFMGRLPTSKYETLPVPVRQAAKRTVKRNGHSVIRNSVVPPNGMAVAQTVPCDGAKTAGFGSSTVPPDGNNELLPLTPRKFRRVVGARGRSGKHRPAAHPDQAGHDPSDSCASNAMTIRLGLARTGDQAGNNADVSSERK